MSLTFSKVVSSVGGLSYSAISMESTKLYWETPLAIKVLLFWPQGENPERA